MKTWIIVLIAVPVSAVGLVALVGAGLPRDHVATRAIRLRQSAATVFATVRDVGAAPQWRRGLKAVTMLPPRDGCLTYREDGPHGATTYVVREERAPERFVVEIADVDLPYGGTWTFELKSVGDETEVRITERGFVKNVIFRALARFVFGHASTMEAYLSDLAKRFGETAQPTDLNRR